LCDVILKIAKSKYLILAKNFRNSKKEVPKVSKTLGGYQIPLYSTSFLSQPKALEMRDNAE